MGGRALIERCIEDSERLKDQDTQLMGCWLLGKLMIHLGDVNGGLEELGTALARAEEMQNHWMAADLKEAINEAKTEGDGE